MRQTLRLMLGCVAAIAVLAAGAAAENVIFTYTPLNPSEITTVSLRGSFNEWGETPMLLQSDGAWSVTIDLPAGEHEYKYYINEGWPQDMAASPAGGPFDGQADGYAPDGHGGQNAVRIVGEVFFEAFIGLVVSAGADQYPNGGLAQLRQRSLHSRRGGLRLGKFPDQRVDAPQGLIVQTGLVEQAELQAAKLQDVLADILASRFDAAQVGCPSPDFPQ